MPAVQVGERPLNVAYACAIELSEPPVHLTDSLGLSAGNIAHPGL